MTRLKRFFREMYWLIVLQADRLFISSSKEKGRVALVRVDAIGDFVIWLHSANRYRSLFPDRKIVLIGNSLWSQLAESFSYWDEVWGIDFRLYKKNLFYRWRMLREISKAGFEIAIQPAYSRNPLNGDSIIRATCAKRRIGSAGDLSNITEKKRRTTDKWYTSLVPASCRDITELERNAEFINHLTGDAIEPKLISFPILKENIDKFSITTEYVIIFPGASWHGRQWPADRFAKLIRNIKGEFSLYPVLCGSSAEWDLCQDIINKSEVTCLNVAGKTSLIELIELTRKAKFVVGNETSIIHIATAVGVPSICITGGGHYGRFVPYPESVDGIKPRVVFEKLPCFGCNWQCSQDYNGKDAVPCIEKIQVDSVMTFIREFNKAFII
jgi:ADP-heptose:LPS heptosyltransferase